MALKWRTTESGRPLVSLQKATFRQGDCVLFPNTEWILRAGECWGLIGDSGEGRGALVHALCGEIPVEKGEVEYGYGSLDPSLENAPEEGVVHVLFADYQIEASQRNSWAQSRWNSGLDTDEHRVADFLSFNEVHEINPFEVRDEDPRVEKRFRALRREAIRLLDIKPLLDRTLDQLSNGERRKVFLVRALLRDPVLLVLEHPFEGLDREYVAHLQMVFERLHAHGLNLVFSVPSLEDLPDLVTHVVEIKRHRITTIGKKKKRGKAKPERAVQLCLPREWRRRIKKRKLPNPLVSMQNVHVSVESKEILRGVDWVIEPGSCWALSGPNGAGKSTLLSLLQGDNPQAYANDISLFGKTLGPGQSVWDVKRRIGSVSPEQHVYFPGDLTALEVVCTGFFDSIRLFDGCGPVRRGIAMDWLSCLGLGEQADGLFSALPAEQQRLVLIARAVVKQVDLLILDEPCMGLNQTHRRQLIDLIDRIVKAMGCTLIYVSHRRDEWPACIDHRLVLREGQVSGKP